MIGGSHRPPTLIYFIPGTMHVLDQYGKTDKLSSKQTEVIEETNRPGLDKDSYRGGEEIMETSFSTPIDRVGRRVTNCDCGIRKHEIAGIHHMIVIEGGEITGSIDNDYRYPYLVMTPYA